MADPLDLATAYLKPRIDRGDTLEQLLRINGGRAWRRGKKTIRIDQNRNRLTIHQGAADRTFSVRQLFADIVARRAAEKLQL